MDDGTVDPNKADVTFVLRGWGGASLGGGLLGDAVADRLFMAGRELLERLRKEAPYSNGTNLRLQSGGKHLRDSLEQHNERRGDEAAVSFSANDYAQLVITGHGMVMPTRAQALRFGAGGAIVFSKFAGPVPANDFVSRAQQGFQPNLEVTAKDMAWAVVNKLKSRFIGF